MKNWKTTLAGFLTGGSVGIDAIIEAIKQGTFDSKTGVQLVLAIGLVLLGAYSKDHNVTGGTTVNQPNDAAAVKDATKISS